MLKRLKKYIFVYHLNPLNVETALVPVKYGKHVKHNCTSNDLCF